MTALVCLAGLDGTETHYEIGPSGQIVLDVLSDDGSSATIQITHGGDGSTHVLTYTDENGNQLLNCGDVILTVS